MGSGALGANHATPSFTSANFRRYWPVAGGATTVAETVRCPCGATSAPSGVRTPSHTIAVVPLASYQWYVRSTGFVPVDGPVSSPVFVSCTLTCTVAPTGMRAGGVGTTYVAVRVLRGAANEVVPSIANTSATMTILIDL